MQTLGFQVFRFTGSEIWKDVFKCADEALNALRKQADERCKQLQREHENREAKNSATTADLAPPAEGD